MARAAALLALGLLGACAAPGRSSGVGSGERAADRTAAAPRGGRGGWSGRADPTSGDARPGAGEPGPDLSPYELQARLGARAASLVGRPGPFQVGAERFPADCIGFVEAVYEAEGIPLRALMRAAAPEERSGVAAAFRAVRAYGSVFGRRGEWPSPGDLVFWHDTYDRDGNGRADDRLTHVGIVEYVVDGTVVFVHRGSKGVARGAMTRSRAGEKAADGVLLNSAIRSLPARHRGVPVLAGELFTAYGRLEP